ncbi:MULTISPECIES: NAD(P)-dependent oxidoreductase [unclassified Rathayibacter]|uniref:NAD(P)-dependent oxidoreductase n=1 Tax=unclassified Rathayibacter TaxID=2609250 RepID=UPI00188ADFBE|nr:MULTISPECIES: NAD(P)-dependent oxidoreductase [unclassified Rathayibacter]MBF4461326.1 lactate dehydrogenase [Rathayibacter sp. VKM Ac-2879]MBF4502737.1 lactate dehydrogenase [Rathayibacter sp. VKM Ac-2878]
MLDTFPPALARRSAPLVTFFGCDPEEARAIEDIARRRSVRCRIQEAPLGLESAALARGTSCVSVNHLTPVVGDTMRALAENGVRHLLTRSIGVDHLDLELAASLGLTVANIPYDPDGVADYTVMLMLMALRHARPTLAATERHDFRVTPPRGRELRSVTVGVLGAGRIGRAVVARLRGFGCRILVVSESGREVEGAESVPLQRALTESDILTLHLPLNERTRHYLSAERLALLRPGALLVNTGRGGLVDTDALVHALEDGRLGGAALDVLDGEERCFSSDHSGRALPHPELARLIALPNVIVTPHAAYFTTRTLHQVVETTLSRCVDLERRTLHV